MLDQQVSELEGRVAALQTEAEADGVAEDLAQDAAGQMPGIARPGALEVVALDELARDGFNAPPQLGQRSAAGRTTGSTKA